MVNGTANRTTLTCTCESGWGDLRSDLVTPKYRTACIVLLTMRPVRVSAKKNSQAQLDPDALLPLHRCVTYLLPLRLRSTSVGIVELFWRAVLLPLSGQRRTGARRRRAFPSASLPPELAQHESDRGIRVASPAQ
jgi:hypothetical protein